MYTLWDRIYTLLATSIEGRSLKIDKHIYKKNEMDEPNLYLERDKSIGSTSTTKIVC